MSDPNQSAAGQPSEAYRRGVERRDRIVGQAGSQRRRLLAALHPDLERYLLEHAWGDVLSRPGLDERTRELVTLGILLALGRDREARTHFQAALNVGLGREELAELLIHTSLYAGFPAMVTGAHLLAEVLEARGELPEISEPTE
ncbi:MAG: carboxymuconolactone decarboxylase family protein [Chloroflexi bacterium]|nr:carboxymuconolactone decarboxylase family protein [Chloroflexota bacterium]